MRRMKVITRSGNEEDVKFDLITDKIKYLSSENEIWGRKLNIEPVFIAQNICGLIHNGITTSQLDDFSASLSATYFKKDPDYLILAGRIAINNHHKNTNSDFYNIMKRLNEIGIVSDDFIKTLKNNTKAVNNMIVYNSY